MEDDNTLEEWESSVRAGWDQCQHPALFLPNMGNRRCAVMPDSLKITEDYPAMSAWANGVVCALVYIINKNANDLPREDQAMIDALGFATEINDQQLKQPITDVGWGNIAYIYCYCFDIKIKARALQNLRAMRTAFDAKAAKAAQQHNLILYFSTAVVFYLFVS